MSGSWGLLTFLVLSSLVIALAYYSLRFIGKWQFRQTRSRRLRVLEAVAVGRDRHVMLVAVGKEVLVVGSSPNGVNLVHKLPEAEGAAMLAEPEPDPTAAAAAGTQEGLESSIQASLTRMRTNLKKDHDQSGGPR